MAVKGGVKCREAVLVSRGDLLKTSRLHGLAPAVEEAEKEIACGIVRFPNMRTATNF